MDTGCLHIVAIVNNVAMNTGCIDLFQIVFLFSLDIYSGEELLDHMVVLFLVLRNLHTVFHRRCTNLPSCQWCMRVLFPPYPCQFLFFVVFLMIAFLTGMRWYLIVILFCISLMTSNVEHLFHVPVGHLYIFFGRISIQAFCPFLIRCFVFWCWVVRVVPKKSTALIQSLWKYPWHFL